MSSLWLRPAYSLAFLLLWAPVFAWAAVEGIGSRLGVAIISRFGVVLWTHVDRTWAYGGWAERWRIATAIDDHRDPGSGHRPDIDSEARHLVARGAHVVQLSSLFLAALGVACLVTAWLRADRLRPCQQ